MTEGIYVVPNLPPGNYRVQVSKVGFKTIIKPDITLNVQDALALNFALPLGAISEIVTIEGGAPLVNTESASVGTVIDRQVCREPSLERAQLQYASSIDSGSCDCAIFIDFARPVQRRGPENRRKQLHALTVCRQISAWAPAGYLGNTGSGSTQAFSALGGTSSLVSVDALQEFRVETSSFAPEFGRAPGGQVMLVTRSGTNDFHGEVFDYFRNTVNGCERLVCEPSRKSASRGTPLTTLAGVFGGPIWKDRTFFFFSYEGARLDLPQTTQIEVPSVYARQSAPSSLAPFLAAYPMPNDVTATPACSPILSQEHIPTTPH